MKMSDKGKEILIKLEGGHRLSSYLDERNIPTIGVGIIFYPDGFINPIIQSGEDVRAYSAVKMGDEITLDQSNWLLNHYLDDFEKHLTAMLLQTDVIASNSQHQFDALVSFCYNEGLEAFQTSHLHDLVRECKTEETEHEFFNWTRAGAPGTSSLGLRWRRHVEANLFMGRI